MNINFLNPFTKKKLILQESGLFLENNEMVFAKRGGAFRVLESDNNYSESFGFQWNIFVKTQIDNSESDVSKVRFFFETNWDKEDLTGKNVLEVGSGAGRFSEVILNHTKANLYSVDYSNAVQANFKNNGHHGERFKLFQASIYDMPFEQNQFDKVICIGVLQHTPDFKASIKSLTQMLKPGGELVVDFYTINGWWTKCCAKYILRPWTKKWSHDKLLRIINKNIDWMIAASHFLNKIKLGFLCRFIPIIDIYGTLPYKTLTKEQLKEWCILDTFDQYSPEHDHPQRVSTVKKWFIENGINVTFSGIKKNQMVKAYIVKGIKPQ